MADKYYLDGKTPVRCDSLEEWARKFEVVDRHVAQDEVGGIRISTVFLGIDHNHFAGGKPLLFESMIFGGAHDGKQDRYSTWEEAEQGHAKMLALVRSTLN
jgi:hypothetical protein